MIHYDSLLQNATEVYYKIRQVSDCITRQFYYKMRHLLQNMRFITNCGSTSNYISSQIVTTVRK